MALLEAVDPFAAQTILTAVTEAWDKVASITMQVANSLPVQPKIKDKGAILVFVSPDFAEDLDFYKKYFPNAKITPLPSNPHKATEAFLGGLNQAAQKHKKIWKVVIDGHGNSEEISIGSMLNSATHVTALLKNMAQIKWKAGDKPEEILILGCGVLSNYALELIIPAVKELGGPSVIISANVSFDMMQVKNYPSPALGLFFKITTNGDVFAYDDFRRDVQWLPDGINVPISGLQLGLEMSSADGDDVLLPLAREALTKNGCFKKNPSTLCLSLETEYQRDVNYEKARIELDRLSSNFRNSTAQRDAKIISDRIDGLPEYNRPEAYLAVVRHAAIGSPEYIAAINGALQLFNGGFQRIEIDNLQAQTYKKFSAGNSLEALATASDKPLIVYQALEHVYFVDIKEPSPNQISMLRAELDYKKSNGIPVTDLSQIHLIERAVAALYKSDISMDEKNKFFHSVLSMVATPDPALSPLLPITKTMRDGLLDVIAKSGGSLQDGQLTSTQILSALFETRSFSDQAGQIYDYSKTINDEGYTGFKLKADCLIHAADLARQTGSPLVDQAAHEFGDMLLNTKYDETDRRTYAQSVVNYYDKTHDVGSQIYETAKTALDKINAAARLRALASTKTGLVGAHH